MDTRRGKKLKNVRNFRSHEDWMKVKKLGRPKQKWYEQDETVGLQGYWYKIKLKVLSDTHSYSDLGGYEPY